MSGCWRLPSATLVRAGWSPTSSWLGTNTGENGGWDPTDLWAVDTAIAANMMTVLELVRSGPVGKYPNDWGFRREIEAVWSQWRKPTEPSEARSSVDALEATRIEGHGEWRCKLLPVSQVFYGEGTMTDMMVSDLGNGIRQVFVELDCETTLICRCGASCRDTSKERGRFMRRHPELCSGSGRPERVDG